MSNFDPNSSDVNPRGGSSKPDRNLASRVEQMRTAARDPNAPRRRRRFTLFDSTLMRFLGVWALVTFLLVQIANLVGWNLTLSDNYSGTLSVTFIIAAVIYMISRQTFDPLRTIWLVDWLLTRGLSPFWSLLRTAWTFLLLGFIAVFFVQCANNENMPIDNVFIMSLDKYWSWLGQFWDKVLWYFGWN